MLDNRRSCRSEEYVELYKVLSSTWDKLCIIQYLMSVNMNKIVIKAKEENTDLSGDK